MPTKKSYFLALTCAAPITVSLKPCSTSSRCQQVDHEPLPSFQMPPSLAANECGQPLTEDAVATMAKTFRRAVNRTEVAFLAIASRHKRGLLPSMKRYLSDAEAGIAEGRGFARVVEAAPAAFANDFDEFISSDDLPLGWGPGFIAVANGWQSLESVAAGTALGGKKRSELILGFLEARGTITLSPTLTFMTRLLATKAVDFPAFVIAYEKEGPTEP